MTGVQTCALPICIPPSPTTVLTADGPFAEGMPLDDSNLVAKALRLADRVLNHTLVNSTTALTPGAN